MVLSTLGIHNLLFILTLVKGDYDIFNEIDEDLTYFNKLQANLTWQALTGSGKFDLKIMAEIGEAQIEWKNEKCSILMGMLEMGNENLDEKSLRKIFILCRGPRYTAVQARDSAAILKALQTMYVDSEICRAPNLTNNLTCYSAEPDLERLFMTSRNQAELFWAWLSWRNKMSPAKPLYKRLVSIQNDAAQIQGYHDIGESWREELETPNLSRMVEKLYNDVKPLFTMLHAYVRHRLTLAYGRHVVSPTKPIPAHLLGNLWAQNWDNIIDLVVPELSSRFNLDRAIRVDQNWTVLDMSRKAEDFYASMGLPLMSDKFWRYSVLENTHQQCHGTAANMFDNDDYRILMCAEPSMEDFYVLHHEIGHIQYYMAYKNQPAIFQDGANSAFHESIGDAVMYGVMTPAHLKRLGLITSTKDPDLDIYLLLRSALNKLPQLGFGLALEQWRWKIQAEEGEASLKTGYNTVPPSEKEYHAKMPPSKNGYYTRMHPSKNGYHTGIHPSEKGDYTGPLLDKGHPSDNSYYTGPPSKQGYNIGMSPSDRMHTNPTLQWNALWWQLRQLHQGIQPPMLRSDPYYFDAAAKFHIIDNTPYIRYVVGGFLQMQIFEALCENANVKNKEPLHRCDIYNSTSAGTKLRTMMSLGSSKHWSDALAFLTNGKNNQISSNAILKYYQPLTIWLKQQITNFHIPVGW